MVPQVEGKSKSAAQAANDARPAFDGPHKPGRHKQKAEKDAAASPAYVVAVTKREPDEQIPPSIPFKYNPDELRAKAKAFMKTGNLTSAERKALEEILGPDKTE
jgi:hypothetical protein